MGREHLVVLFSQNFVNIIVHPKIKVKREHETFCADKIRIEKMYMSETDNDNATKTRTTKNIAERRGKTVGKAFSGTEECPAEQSQINGIQRYIPDDQGSGIRGSRSESSQSRSPATGEILEAVKLIEEKHLSYVRSHQQRLMTRLDESRESESDFKKAIQELEAKIQQLISDKGVKEPE